jgi:hypothetical protein
MPGPKTVRPMAGFAQSRNFEYINSKGRSPAGNVIFTRPLRLVAAGNNWLFIFKLPRPAAVERLKTYSPGYFNFNVPV